MQVRFLSILLLAIVSLQSCKPDPIDIAIPQQPKRLAISSALYDEHTVFVSAGYSISSFQNLSDTTRKAASLPGAGGPVVDSGLVTITGEDGRSQTLKMVSAGLFASRDLSLHPGERYTLRVQDLVTGISASAVTVFESAPVITKLEPSVQRGSRDTSVRLRYRLEGVQPDQYYFISYTAVSVNGGGLAGKVGLPVLNAFEPRKVELVSGADAVGGVIEKEVPLYAKASDSIYVHCGRIEKGYFEYLAAYKRSGNLVSQLTGEPVHLPANVQPGFGYFALYLPHRQLFDLSRL